MPGGETRVVELLENEARQKMDKPLLEKAEQDPQAHQKSFCNFFLRPCLIGRDLLSIEKFGLVQYVRHN